MKIRYYFSIFPMEALIASQLEPAHFGSYMATGTKKGSSEKIIFCELLNEFGGYFDWDYAHERCVPHPTGEPKNSLYLAVYRVLEHIPFESFGPMFLTTQDGRTLELEQKPIQFTNHEKQFFVYKELCPVNPIVVSSLDPADFAAYMTNPEIMTSVPKLAFADLKTIDFTNPDATGHLGSLYERKIGHLKTCVHSVTELKDKVNKIFDRSYIESFSYQTIKHGIYIGNGEDIVSYPMKSVEELRNKHYDWAKSAMII